MSRLLIGLLVSTGIFLGLNETLGVLLSMVFGDALNDSTTNQTISTIFRIIAVGTGALFCGAGRPSGILPGAVLGMILGCAFTLYDASTQYSNDFVIGFFQLVGIVITSAIASSIGSRLWIVPPELPIPVSPNGSSLAQLVEATSRGPVPRSTRWGQIILATMISTGGVAFADPIREYIRFVTNHQINFGGPSMVNVASAQIGFTIVFLSSIFSAINSGAGVRHGVYSGAISGLLLCILPILGVKTIFPVMEGLVSQFGSSVRHISATVPTAALLFGITAISAAGGWLGGQLFPPVSGLRKRKRYV